MDNSTRYFGKANLGNEDRSSSSSSSSSRSRSGMKKLSHSADHKPNKQPQRGLGVAQLEKIRLQSIQMGICSSTTHESERAYNINYADSNLITPTPRWNPSGGMLAENQHFAQHSMSGQYFYTMQLDQEQRKKGKKNDINNKPAGMGSEMEEKHELDLELRLSL
ncbi:protein SPEAR3-like [Impatiens glandulifera]|uniref:protein SPEAR3-like n=1 Tax=Impatiens glandulifera TaxID=253017 RepID=UPI001FB1060A|nr:protein SPEAR3-like [Impatiens glandulifera]